ncbi:Bromodomain-containing protein [Giardia muris]|uniref:Bromodomain-containing protein n=1 Tax=Giardia muris TaxID=5742 RepID=A0A4Z1SV61_GIAMU|nr:Bromodomain-containing protein [Giardia muris]|eukprot:TNJ29684.1 Bromodomain-containing protein [Giardia muris]
MYSPLIHWLKDPPTPDVLAAIQEIMQRRHLSDLFGEPVLVTLAPNPEICRQYRNCIPHPCSFREVRENLAASKYPQLGMIIYHLLLIVHNSIVFNKDPKLKIEVACSEKHATPVLRATRLLYESVVKLFMKYLPEAQTMKLDIKYYDSVYASIQKHYSCAVKDPTPPKLQLRPTKATSSEMIRSTSPSAGKEKELRSGEPVLKSRRTSGSTHHAHDGSRASLHNLEPSSTNTMGESRLKQTKLTVEKEKVDTLQSQNLFYQPEFPEPSLGTSLSTPHRCLLLYACVQRFKEMTSEVAEATLNRIRSRLSLDPSITDIDLATLCKNDTELVKVRNLIFATHSRS